MTPIILTRSDREKCIYSCLYYSILSGKFTDCVDGINIFSSPINSIKKLDNNAKITGFNCMKYHDNINKANKVQ